MDAYLYQAALYCGPCVVKALHAAGKAAPGALDMPPADALFQIVSANGFDSQSDYDSDDLPKGPYADGGGEADTPQHCDACGLFLENPLTGDGTRYVNEKLIEHARDGSGTRAVLKQWAQHYHAQSYEPGEATLDDLRFEYALEDDEWGACMGWWFAIAGELYTRNETLPEQWHHSDPLRIREDDQGGRCPAQS
jgi:hypothetical protein